MSRAIFTNQTPAIPDEGDGAPGLTLATVFTTSVEQPANGIWWYFPATLPGGPVQGLLYQVGTTSLLASATFSSPVAGTWNLATFSSPVTLQADVDYLAAVWTPDRYVATGALHASAITNGDFTSPADDPGLRNGRFNSGGSPTFPNSSFNSNGYLVDVDITSSTTYPLSAAVVAAVDLAAAARLVAPLTAAPAVDVDLTGAATPVRLLQGAVVATGTLTGAATVVRRLAPSLAVDVDLAAFFSGGRDVDLSFGQPSLKWRTRPLATKWRFGGTAL